ncbi:MAG: hypothetical protein HY062_13600 [Bacteroidetes bacterium]|nr:hypothetical protein [Bacteroidota bacterium]
MSEKIKGVNLVSSKQKCQLTGIDSIKGINANWVSLCPFAFLYSSSDKLDYNSAKNWWGDTKTGLIDGVKKARINKLKVLVKPHYWLIGKGWAGDFDLSGKKRLTWESNYKNYILYLAKLCDSLGVEMLALGTELKTYTEQHPDFFIDLIKETRKIYKGNLTYAANWDEFENIKFWDKLDFIGVDAYFPLSEQKTPEINTLEKSWKKESVKLKAMSLKYQKKIIFTEYGYKSIDFAAYKQWEFENTPKSQNINLLAQVNAYTAFYHSVWNEDFLAGGFIWKWYNNNEGNNDKFNSDYTPQQKPANEIIKKWYSLR